MREQRIGKDNLYGRARSLKLLQSKTTKAQQINLTTSKQVNNILEQTEAAR